MFNSVSVLLTSKSFVSVVKLIQTIFKNTTCVKDPSVVPLRQKNENLIERTSWRTFQWAGKQIPAVDCAVDCVSVRAACSLRHMMRKMRKTF